MVRKTTGNNVHRYKGLYYGRNRKGDYVVLPLRVKDLNDPAAFPVVPAFCEIDVGEREKKAREYIDFITTVEEGSYYIAENVHLKKKPTDEIDKEPFLKTSWWVSIVKGVLFIADTTGEKAYPRPQKHEWKKATATQIDLLKKFPLIRVI